MLLISMIVWLASPIVLGPIFVYRHSRKKQARPPKAALLLGFVGLELVGLSAALLATSELGWHLPALSELPWRTVEIMLCAFGFFLSFTGFALVGNAPMLLLK